MARKLLRESESEAVALDCQRRLWLLKLLGSYVDRQVRSASDAVDAELDEGRGRRCTVEAMRHLPRRPGFVGVHPDATAWIEADLRRAMPDWPKVLDAGGADYGYDWRLESPTRPWRTSRWRISWLGLGSDPTCEVYAIQILDGGRRAGARARGDPAEQPLQRRAHHGVLEVLAPAA